MTWDDVLGMGRMAAAMEQLGESKSLNALALCLARYRRQWGGPFSHDELTAVAIRCGFVVPIDPYDLAEAYMCGSEAWAKDTAAVAALN